MCDENPNRDAVIREWVKLRDGSPDYTVNKWIAGVTKLVDEAYTQGLVDNSNLPMTVIEHERKEQCHVCGVASVKEYNRQMNKDEPNDDLYAACVKAQL